MMITKQISVFIPNTDEGKKEANRYIERYKQDGAYCGSQENEYDGIEIRATYFIKGGEDCIKAN